MLRPVLTWHDILGLVPATEARDTASDKDHEADRDAADDEQELQVDLAVAAREPIPAFASDLRSTWHASSISVTQSALARSFYKKFMNEHVTNCANLAMAIT